MNVLKGVFHPLLYVVGKSEEVPDVSDILWFLPVLLVFSYGKDIHMHTHTQFSYRKHTQMHTRTQTASSGKRLNYWELNFFQPFQSMTTLCTVDTGAPRRHGAQRWLIEWLKLSVLLSMLVCLSFDLTTFTYTTWGNVRLAYQEFQQVVVNFSHRALRVCWHDVLMRLAQCLSQSYF